jgi:hypothetical protein
VATIVKAHAARVGLDPDDFAAIAYRSGFLTSAAARGASIFKMMDVSRHKSVDTLRGYVRDAELFRDHAGAGENKLFRPVMAKPNPTLASGWPSRPQHSKIFSTIRPYVNGSGN